jgi:hypothetical protein
MQRGVESQKDFEHLLFESAEIPILKPVPVPCGYISSLGQIDCRGWKELLSYKLHLNLSKTAQFYKNWPER